jgi:adenylate cyclase
VEPGSRRLAAILAADVVGYSRLIGADEPGTLAKLASVRSSVIAPQMATHGGRVFKTAGDGLLAEFASGVQAVQCAIAIQQAMRAQDGIQLRIGLHSADVTVQPDGDLLGDGVNVAARLEALADPGGICISGRVREDAAGKLTLSVDDLGEPELKNITQRHRIFRVRLGAPERPTLPLPDKPSLAVLPFANMSGDPEQEYFADGMVEEIITALSRIRWLFVIARNSTFTYKGSAIDIKRVARELGVRYVLEGSVRKGGGRVRITAQLIEAETGTHLWADHFDGSLEDVFDLQEQVAISVAGVIEPALQAAETARSANRLTSDLTAYDLYLRSCSLHPSNPQALALAEQAITRDAHYGAALGRAAICCMHLVSDGSTPDRDANRQKGVDFAGRAIEVAGNEARVLADAAHVLACFGEDIDAMTALVDRALAFNPSYAQGWYISGIHRLWAGQMDLAIKHAEMALRLSPREQAGSTSFLIGAALFFGQRFDEAAPRLRTAIEETPVWLTPYRFLAACYAHMGLLDEARATIAQLRALTPEMIPNYPLPFRDPRHRELYFSGLCLAAGQMA